jgi:hypothetical protein
MPFLCKSHINGEIVEHLILFETFEESVIWANRHARVVRSIGHGWDTVYQVDIYEVPFNLPFVDAYSPGNPIKIVRPS